MNGKRAVLMVMAAVLCIPGLALGGAAAPREVLDARQGLVRVYSEADGNVTCGSGFAVGTDSPVRYIVTNCHVAGLEDALVTVRYSDALTVSASVYMKNDSADLCVLKLQTPLYDLQPLTLDDTHTAAVGDAIYALGFPAAPDAVSKGALSGADGVSVTDGIISALKTGKLTDDGTEIGLIQFTAAISAGNSGGPLLSSAGYVVGVNTLSMKDAQNINMAVSVQALIRLLDAGGVPWRSASEQDTRRFWLIALTAVAAAAVVAGVLILVWKHKHPRTAFQTWLFSPVISREDKLRVLLGVARQIKKQHDLGRYPLNISPETIRLTKRGAVLCVSRWQIDGGGALPAYAGYSAPERYTSTTAAGPWSDVYAVSALVYAALTCFAPPPAFERADDTLPFVASDALIDTVKRALSLEPACRPSLATLIASLETRQPVHSFAYAANISQKVQHTPPSSVIAAAYKEKHGEQAGQTAEKPKSPVNRKKRTVLWAAATALIVLAATLFVMEINYAQAAFYVQKGDYALALKCINGVADFYKDTSQLSVFAEAGAALENAEYETASRLFASLGGYRGADELALESAYRHAQFHMQRGDYASAKPMLAALDNYKDAPALCAEAAIQNAYAFLDASMYLSALDELRDAGADSNAEALAQQVRAGLYAEGLDAFGDADIYTATICFAPLSGYEKADALAALCERLTEIESGASATREDYALLAYCADSVDVTDYLTCDAWFAYYLEGRWHGEGHTFRLSDDGEVSTTMPWQEAEGYALRNATIYVINADVHTPLYRVSAVDLNKVTFACEMNGRTYTLTREQ